MGLHESMRSEIFNHPGGIICSQIKGNQIHTHSTNNRLFWYFDFAVTGASTDRTFYHCSVKHHWGKTRQVCKNWKISSSAFYWDYNQQSNCTTRVDYIKDGQVCGSRALTLPLEPTQRPLPPPEPPQKFRSDAVCSFHTGPWWPGGRTSQERTSRISFFSSVLILQDW